MSTSAPQGNTGSQTARYIALPTSIAFLFSKIRLVGLSLVLFFVTVLMTWLCYEISIDFVDGFTGNFFVSPPDTATILGWLKNIGWVLLKWLYLFISRIAAFYLAFLLAFTVTTPGYVLLATAAEKIHAGDDFEMDDGLSVKGIMIDLWEGLKVAGFGIIVTIAALFANFIPVIGQIVAFLLYTYFSALMFVDYAASRRRWSLGRKIGWLKQHSGHSFRLGLFPALVSMVPILNVFIMAILFPILTVHATLNFTSQELAERSLQKGDEHGH